MSESTHAAGARFPTTHLSFLDLAGRPEAPEFRAAWEAFFRAYWRPMYAWLRRTGSPTEEASDLVQDLFLEGLQSDLLRGYDRARGSLRGYLKGCLRHRRLRLRDQEGARPDRLPLPFLDAKEVEACLADASARDPEATFEEEWARQVLASAIAEVERTLADLGDSLSLRLLREWVLALDRPPAQTLAEGLGISPGDLWTRATRLRHRLLQEVETQVRACSPGAAPVGEEVDEVLRCLTM